MTKSFFIYKYGSALFALCLWGGWSFYVNSQVSLADGIKSGLAQGLTSFCLTLIVVTLVVKIYQHVNAGILRFILPPLIVPMVLLTLLVTLHTLVGTPEIARTIIPPISLAFIFCAFTTHQLHRAEKHSLKAKQ